MTGPAVNLVQNGDFSQGTTFWNKDAGSTWNASSGGLVMGILGQTPEIMFAAEVPAFGSSETIEMGIEFQPTVNGVITAVRFYRRASATATSRNVALWAGGVKVATGTSVAEAGTGWVRVALTTPVTVTAGTTYIASYSTHGDYGFFALPTTDAAAHLTPLAGRYSLTPGSLPTALGDWGYVDVEFVSSVGGDWYTGMLWQNIPQTIQQYTLKFTARASTPVDVAVVFGVPHTIHIGTSQETFIVTFDVATDEPAAFLHWVFGLSSPTPWTFHLDNVVLLPTSMIPVLTVTYDTARGYARFVVDNAPAGYTVKRVANETGRLTNIVGYETDAWHQPSGTGFGEDYRVPIGDVVTYVLVPVGATQAPAGAVSDTIVTPGNQSWLRDVRIPALSTQVIVISTGTETEPVNQRIFEISGRHLPLVVHDVRFGRRGIVTMFVPTPEDRLAIEALLITGRPLLLNICSSKLWEPCMMAIGESRFTRYGKGSKWVLELDYVEVEDPFSNVERNASPLWSDVKAGNPPEAGDPVPVTWAWIRENFTTWLHVALGERN